MERKRKTIILGDEPVIRQDVKMQPDGPTNVYMDNGAPSPLAGFSDRALWEELKKRGWIIDGEKLIKVVTIRQIQDEMQP